VRRIVWQIVDGLPHWLLERFRERPELDRLMSLHRARLLPVGPNCQTPPSLATLLTGVAPEQHGIMGYDLPDPRDPTGTLCAFDATPTAELVWESWPSARLVHVPFARKQAHVQSSYGFAEKLDGPQVVPFENGVARLDLPGVGRTIDLVASELAPGQWKDLALAPQVRTQVSHAMVDGAPTLIMLGAWRDPGTRFLNPFFGGALSKAFRAGRLGRRIIDGGLGAAELLFFDTLQTLAQRYGEELVAAVVAGDAELVIGYQPFLDLLLHEIGGLLDPASAHHRPEAVPLVESILISALRVIQLHIEALVWRLHGAAFVVSSDHGMAPVDTVLYPNQVLYESGLLARDADGRIDAARSHAFFHPAETGLLQVASATNRRRALAALDQAFAGIAHAEAGGQTYLIPGSRRVMKADLGKGLKARSQKTGDHAMNDGDRRLDGVLIDVAGCLLPDDTSEVHAAQVRNLLRGS
jgi:hypothetical protein